jgi:hypothetical protein
MEMRVRKFFGIGVATFGIALGMAGSSWAGSCVDKGCHAPLIAHKYLHGPLAAESVGGQGCASCHIAAGAPCSGAKGGVFKLVDAKDAICTLCHEASESPNHVGRKTGCLTCHDPHGGDDSAVMLRKKQ